MATFIVKELSSVVGKAVGLIFAKEASTILIRTRFGVHTFGMRFPIDVIVLDRQHTVVKVKKNLRPNRIWVWPIVYDIVVELPAGGIDKHHVKLGEKINIVFHTT